MPIDRAAAESFLIRTAWAAAAALVTWLLSRVLRRATLAALRRRHAAADATLLLGNLTRWLVLAVGTLAVIGAYSGDTLAWVVGSLGVLGLVAGLAFQDLLKNVLAGVWVLVERPIRLGEEIEVAGCVGTVEEIAFRVTRLRRADGREVLVPNATLLTSPIVNHSRGR